ncbi:MAG: ABC transporter substrate-binding protein [Candidatus Pacebacteria bacterium]|nr:ABC transporter substrate-binding protein [Candidatus Paceibacterota bacterium]MDD5357233.1 ABC transporter substrate-binding protein [Candidatus Paceibacterota bacterium]
MDKKVIGAVFVILFIFLLVFLVSNKKPESFRIGVIAPITGNFAALGEHIHNGFEMAKEDVLAQGKIKSFDILYEDACQPKEAVAAAQKFISTDKITILGGSFCVVGFVPVLPIMEEAKIVSFNIAPNPDSVLGHKYLVSTNSSIQLKAKQIAQFAHDTLGGKKASVIYYNTPLGADYNKYLSETFEKAGGKILSSEVTAVDATDFRTQLTKIKADKVDIIFVTELAAPLGNLLKQARELGIQAKIVGNSQNEDPNVLSTAGIAAEGFIISSDEPFPKTDKILDFAKRYEAKFNQKPDTFAANAYDSLMLQVDAYNSCGADSDCVLNYLHRISNYTGVSGQISIAENGTASKPTIFKIVKNSQFVKFEQ